MEKAQHSATSHAQVVAAAVVEAVAEAAVSAVSVIVEPAENSLPNEFAFAWYSLETEHAFVVAAAVAVVVVEEDLQLAESSSFVVLVEV
jgi:hypothetical protein